MELITALLAACAGTAPYKGLAMRSFGVLVNDFR